ncbi:MAG: helix-turn-helix domain-containing protein [Myxococcota bacterium]
MASVIPPSPEAQATSQRILRAARRCFSERGYAGTSLRWVAKHAEVTQPLVSHYFGSKEGLFDAVIQESVAEYVEAQSAQFSLSPEDPDFFFVGLLVLFRWLGEQREMLRLVQWARLEQRLPRAGQEVWNEVRIRIQALQAEGILRADLDVDAGLIFVDAAMKGFWDRVREYEAFLEADAREAMERSCERTFLLGFVGAFFASVHREWAEERIDRLLRDPRPGRGDPVA